MSETVTIYEGNTKRVVTVEPAPASPAPPKAPKGDA